MGCVNRCHHDFLRECFALKRLYLNSVFKKTIVFAGFFNSQCISFNQIIISFWSLPFLQKFPVQPDLHPESQKPLTLLHPAQVSMHISEQLCPKYPLRQAS